MEQKEQALNNLISEAEQSIKSRKGTRPSPIKSAPNRTPIALILMAMAVFTWIWVLWPESIGEDQIRSDLDRLLQSAREQIESTHAQTGKLPTRLTDVSLATIVKYDVIDGDAVPPKYRLSAEIDGVHQSWTTE